MLKTNGNTKDKEWIENNDHDFMGEQFLKRMFDKEKYISLPPIKQEFNIDKVWCATQNSDKFP